MTNMIADDFNGISDRMKALDRSDAQPTKAVEAQSAEDKMFADAIHEIRTGHSIAAVSDNSGDFVFDDMAGKWKAIPNWPMLRSNYTPRVNTDHGTITAKEVNVATNAGPTTIAKGWVTTVLAEGHRIGARMPHIHIMDANGETIQRHKITNTDMITINIPAGSHIVLEWE